MLILLYGLIAYLMFFATILYAICFVGGFITPTTLDRGGPESSLPSALIINVLLLGLFAVQHTIMARPAFKNWWTRIIPKSIERSTFVVATSLVMWLMFWQWRPIASDLWNLQSPAARVSLWAVFALGWLLVFYSTFIIDHFDLFGLRRVFRHYRAAEPLQPEFQVRSLYRFVRHPLMLGFVLGIWAIPQMTLGHALFALVVSIYVLIGIQLEERDLIAVFGEKYKEYQRTTPMLLPIPKSWFSR